MRTTSNMRVLVVGGGGREHALADRLSRSASVGEVLTAPGNAGTAALARSLDAKSSVELAEAAVRERVDLAVIGPEAPLVEGLADLLRKKGIATFGPSAAAARLEGSKVFMKQLLAEVGIRTAAFAAFDDAELAVRHLRSLPTPPVVKADGLCAGKGVVVASTHEEAESAVRGMLSGAAFGEAGRRVVLEERLEGTEASVHAICDGERFVILPAVQDHKRIGDGDQGPNTGGMGVYGPTPIVSAALEERIGHEVIAPVLRGLAERGAPFCGSLFAGLMITAAGEPLVLEYNVRFGDPETEVLMELLDGDFGEVLYTAAAGRLDTRAVVRTSRHAVAVVMASEGYPGKPTTGDAIVGIEQAARMERVRVLHAGTARSGDRVVTAGGRVLVVTASGDTLQAARDRAYDGVAAITFRGMQYRKDIGARALQAP